MKGRKLGFKPTIWNIRKRYKYSTRTKRRNKNKKNEDRLRDLWDISKHANICIIGMPEEEEE